MLRPLRDPCKKLILLKNFYLLQKGKKSVRTENTCPIDAMFHAFYSLYVDYDCVRDIVNKCTEQCDFSNLIKTAHTAENVKLIYEVRNNILLDHFENRIEDFKNGHIKIDCSCDINYLFQNSLCNHFNSFKKAERRLLDYDLEVFDKCDLSELNKLLLDSLNQNKLVSRSSEEQNWLSDLVMVDLQALTHMKRSSIENLPNELVLFGSAYKLVSVIEFIGDGVKKMSMGHYVTHVLRKNMRWKLFDDLASKIPDSNIKQVIQPQVLFYIKSSKL